MTETITWISVDDELPDSCRDVLVIGKPDGRPWTGHYEHADKCWYWDAFGGEVSATHWAEMPKGPTQ